MPAIFISYRREDSIAYSGRLYDRLTAEFGKGQVFMDIDSIDPGADFVEVIEQTVAACDAVLVVIGRQWLTVADAQGRRRIENPADFVRLEVETALSRKVRVVPVLVGGAQMPRSDELPATLGGLLRRHALDLPDTAFHQALERLITSIRRDEAKAREQAELERVAREARSRDQAQQERLAREAKAREQAEQERPAPEAKSQEHVAQREYPTDNVAYRGTTRPPPVTAREVPEKRSEPNPGQEDSPMVAVPAPAQNRLRRWLLLYKPSRQVAWVPRVLFYFFAGCLAIWTLCIPVLGIEVYLVSGSFSAFMAFLFRYVSIRLDRPIT